MRELVVSYDMSMSLSMSMSYGYDSQDDLDNMDGEGSNGGTPTDGDTTAPESTPAPTNVTDTNAPNATETSAPSGFPTESPTKAPLPSCYGMEFTILESPLFIETSREGISFSVLENALEDAMRDVLPFCEDLDQRRLEDAGAGGGYYIGNVDLVGGETGGKIPIRTKRTICRG